jgi:hypothetical protein
MTIMMILQQEHSSRKNMNIVVVQHVQVFVSRSTSSNSPSTASSNNSQEESYPCLNMISIDDPSKMAKLSSKYYKAMMRKKVGHRNYLSPSSSSSS